MARSEATVNIEVKGALQGAAEVKTLSKAIDHLDSRSRRLSSGQSAAASSTNILGSSILKAKRSFDSFDKGVKMTGMGLSKFLGLAIKGAIASFALLSASLMGIHALFIAGKWLHKAYSWGMTAMAGAAASAAVALGTAAAAIREQQAAMYAFTKGGAGEFISGTNQVRNAMRTLQSDSQLAGLGVAALNKSYAAMAKSMKSSQIAQSGAMLKKLMDFGAAGQDPAAAAEKVGALIEALNNSKTSMAGVKTAAKALGPQMEQALKKAKVTSKKQMKELIMSGELAKAGGVAGQFEAVNSTLIGQAKAFFTQIKGEFADFGQQFLEPAKVAMQKIFKIIKTDLLRVSGSLGEFGKGDFMDGLVGAVEKVSNFFVKMMREWLPKTDGFFSGMNKWWGNTMRWFQQAKRGLEPFVEGAKTVEKMFSPMLRVIKEGFVDLLKEFNTNAIEQAGTFKEFGENIGGFVEQLFNTLQIMEEIRRKAMPFLSDVLGGLTSIFKMLNSMLGTFGSMFGGAGGLMGLALVFRQMKNTKGGLSAVMPSATKVMNVTAGTVNMGGQGQAPGRMSSGASMGAGGRAAGGAPVSVRMSSGQIVSGPGGAAGARYLGGNQPGYALPWQNGLARFSKRSQTSPDFVGHGGYDRRSNSLMARKFRDYRLGRGMDRYNAKQSAAYTQTHAGVPLGIPTHGATAGATGYSPLGQRVTIDQARALVATGQAAPGLTATEYMNQRNASASGIIPGQIKARDEQIRRGGGGVNIGKTPRAKYQNGNLVRQFGAGVRGFGNRGVTSARGMFGNISAAANTQVENAPGFLQSSLTGRQMGIERVSGPTGAVEIVHPKTGNVVGALDQNTGKFKGVTTRNAGFGLKRKIAAHNIRQNRSSRLGSAILGNDEKKIGGVNRSMGAKMGVGIGMGMLSQHMAPEAQGAMAMGAMVGQFNPLAGLAVGLGGAALSARTGKGGAVTGAGAGAAIGTMIAPGIGTAVGAGLGAITGAIMGWSNGIKARAKEAKQAMTDFVNGLSTKEFSKRTIAIKRQEESAARGESLAGSRGALQGVASSTARQMANVTGMFSAQGLSMDKLKTINLRGRRERTGDVKKGMNVVDAIRSNPAFKGLISDEQYADIKGSKAEGLSKLGKELPEQMAAMEAIGSQEKKRMDMLTKMSGKSGGELEVLARKMGVNLYDSTMKMTDVVEKLGLATVKTAQELKNLNIDTFLGGVSEGFDKAIQQANAPKIYDERGRAVFDVVKGGGDVASTLEALKSFQESALSMGKTPIESFYEQQRQVGTMQAPGQLFQKNGAWAKMDPSKFFTPEVTQALAAQAKSTESGFVGTAAQETTGMLANAGMMGNTAQITSMIQSMTAPNRERFLADVESKKFNIKDTFATTTEEQAKSIYTRAGFSSKEEYMANKVNTAFGEYGLTGAKVDVASINKDTNAVADKMTTASDTFKTAVETFNSNMASYFTDSAGKPEWWTKEAMKEIMKGDTNTPRGGVVGDTTTSRLSQTMARHSAINGSVAGNRSITSSYRTTGLGSMNSDHVTGRAIDLVGQNLGSYAVATRNAGGFAEFHGSGGGRHLHAVPGPEAIGDTAMPRSNQMAMSSSSSVASGGSNYTFNINGGQSNPEEIANMVMSKIRTTEQRIRERT